MGEATGEAEGSGLRAAFDRRLKLEFHGANVTSDAGLLAFRNSTTPSASRRWQTEVLADVRTGEMPAEGAQWSLTSLREKVVKIGAKVIAHGRYLVFQMAEVAVPRELFGRLLERIARLRPPVVARC